MTADGAMARQVHDFDFQVGTWSVRHRRLVEPLSGSEEWSEYVGRATAWTLFGGAVSIDEIALSDSDAGMSLRLLDPGGTWTIYWVHSRDGRLQAPVAGRWQDGVFVGQGEDTLRGRPILARYRWDSITAGTARWQQAFSVDGGETWETNWVMEWTRPDARTADRPVG
jgi:hypothetical protein